jgi:hypothetical protein
MLGRAANSQAGRYVRETAAETVGNGLNDWASSKYKEYTGQTMTSPPPNTATGMAGSVLYTAGKSLYNSYYGSGS